MRAGRCVVGQCDRDPSVASRGKANDQSSFTFQLEDVGFCDVAAIFFVPFLHAYVIRTSSADRCKNSSSLYAVRPKSEANPGAVHDLTPLSRADADRCSSLRDPRRRPDPPALAHRHAQARARYQTGIVPRCRWHRGRSLGSSVLLRPPRRTDLRRRLVVQVRPTPNARSCSSTLQSRDMSGDPAARPTPKPTPAPRRRRPSRVGRPSSNRSRPAAVAYRRKPGPTRAYDSASKRP